MPLRRRNPPWGSASRASTNAGSAIPRNPVAEPAPDPGPAPTSEPVPPSTDVLLRQLIEACVEKVRDQVPELPAGQDASDRPLKARNPNLYYGHSHIECYHFCQQCKDHCETAGATSHKRVPFAASFLKDRILHCWQQHKARIVRNRAVALTWDEIKAFLRKSLGESTAFVDNIWSKIRRDSQYQLEEVQDWTTHLEHLQSILMEFDANCAQSEGVLGRYFYEGLRPSIKLWIVEEGRELDDWDDLVKMATRAEAKANLQPASIICEMDQSCLQSNRPIPTTMTQEQGTQDSGDNPIASVEHTTSEEPESLHPETACFHSAQSKILRAKTSTPKSWRQQKEQRRLEQSRNTETPIRNDRSHITCLNCDKEGHHADKCPTDPKTHNEPSPNKPA